MFELVNFFISFMQSFYFIAGNWVKKLTENEQIEDALKVLDVARDIYDSNPNVNYLIADALLRYFYHFLYHDAH